MDVNKEYLYEYKGKRILIEKYLKLKEIPFELSEDYYFDAKYPLETTKYLNDKNEIDNVDIDFLNKYQRNYASSRLHFYSEIYSSIKRKVIINIYSDAGGKLWVNKNCVSVHERWSQYYITVYLNKGINTVLYQNVSDQKKGRFSLQIMNYEFEMSNDYQAISNVGTAVKIDSVIILKDNNYNVTDKYYKFMLVNGTDDEFRIKIRDSLLGDISEFKSRYNQIVNIDLQNLRNLHKNPFRHNWIGCFCMEEASSCVAGIFLVLNDYSYIKKEIEERLRSLSEKVDDNVKQIIYLAIEKQNTDNSCKNYQDVLGNIKLAELIEKNEFSISTEDEKHCAGGVHQIYINLKLDGNPARILYKVPCNYDKNKQYPAFFALSTNNEDNFSWHDFQNDIDEQFFCFDISGKGSTGGSYVGEASILEIMEWIFENYSIDKNRIYLLGYSNGAYAVYALSQNYPHLAAAIFPLAGQPESTLLTNLSNVKVHQPVSEKDVILKNGINSVKKALYKYGNYYQYKFDELIHIHFAPYIFHKQILNRMLETRKNDFPERIVYKTHRNRHLQSYWIKLHGIRKNSKDAYIKAEILNKNTVKLLIRNCTGVTVHIPPQIDKNNFCVIINGKCIEFKSFKHDIIYFKKINTWKIINNEPIIDVRKGTGILDVYMKSMRIVIPKEHEFVRQIAYNLSRPNTNANDHQIYTDYPIYYDDEVADEILSHNIILIDYNKSNKAACTIETKVNYDLNGFTYLGKYYKCEYLIMQIIPHPKDNERSVLLISSNSKDLLTKNIFLRKMVLPYYVNSINPLLNNEALIMIDKNFYGIYEWGTPLKKI